MATHSSVLAWKITGTGEPGGLLSMGSHRVGHDWSDLAVAALLIGSTAFKSLQLFMTLWDLMDYNPPGSSVHGILQARILEWVAMPSSRGIFPTQGSNQCHLCPLHWQAGSLPLTPPGKPFKSSTECKFMKKKINTHAKGHCMSKNMKAKVRMRKRSERHQDSPGGEFWRRRLAQEGPWVFECNFKNLDWIW